MKFFPFIVRDNETHSADFGVISYDGQQVNAWGKDLRSVSNMLHLATKSPQFAVWFDSQEKAYEHLFQEILSYVGRELIQKHSFLQTLFEDRIQ